MFGNPKRPSVQTACRLPFLTAKLQDSRISSFWVYTSSKSQVFPSSEDPMTRSVQSPNSVSADARYAPLPLVTQEWRVLVCKRAQERTLGGPGLAPVERSPIEDVPIAIPVVAPRRSGPPTEHPESQRHSAALQGSSYSSVPAKGRTWRRDRWIARSGSSSREWASPAPWPRRGGGHCRRPRCSGTSSRRSHS